MTPPRSHPLIVAIDGPAGAGKGTVARLVAERLGIPYLDTGAMYRAVALSVLEAGVDPGDRERVAAEAARAQVDLEPTPDGGLAVLLDGEPVEERIRTPAVGEATSRISAYPEVRRRMVALQRACGRRHGGVVEGRDIGTRVFPETPHKFFLDARFEVRVDRRLRQLRQAGREVPRQEVEGEMTSRDERDRGRADSPLTCDGSYRRIDTSGLTAEEVAREVLRSVRERLGDAGGA